MILPMATLRLLFFGLTICTDCPILNYTHSPSTKQSMTYHIQYKFLIINVSAINILCEITFFFLALQYDVHIVLKIHIQQCIRHLYGSENIQG